MDLLEKTINRIKQLKQYQGFTEIQLRDIAQELIDKKVFPSNKDVDLDVENLFIDKNEKKEARRLLNKYLLDYTIETISDKNTLNQLIFLEIFNQRIQNELNKQGVEISTKTVENLHKNLIQITLLKDKLGLSRDKNSFNRDDAYTALEVLKKKFKVWAQENQASREAMCPHCKKKILFKIRTDIWELQKHPFFKDRVLGNSAIIKLYQEGKLSRKDVGNILECSSDYIDWLIEKWNLIPTDYPEETHFKLPVEKMEVIEDIKVTETIENINDAPLNK